MLNETEHKQLLAQIAELESDSVNYFNVEEEFFFIDSNNLHAIQTRLYGYSIQATGIYENDNLTEAATKNLDGRGCYVHVGVKDGKITIRQDLNGSWGIYLFRNKDYFALSNSFFFLLDHLRLRFPLTLNRDYCNYLVTDALCSHTYSETAINEIELLDRSAAIFIDTEEKTLQIEFTDYKEHTVPLNSTKGIAILDRWLDFWSGVLRGVAQHTQFISADLSGGFDSRISLVTLLNSGIDLNKIRIFSVNAKRHTYAEDYAIASQIAQHYGFKLNQPLPQSQFLNYSLADVFNFNQYCGQTFTNMPWFSSQKRVDKVYTLDGFAGEMLRDYWYFSPATFINSRFSEISRRHFSSGVTLELFHAIETIVKAAARAVCAKYKITDPNSPSIMQYFYQETRCRHHFGKGSTLFGYPLNILHLSPALDPEIRTLQLYAPECSDPNLLIALIFTRYAPELLEFPFQGEHRFIAPETVNYAETLNEYFPHHVTTDKINHVGEIFNLQPRDLRAEQILTSGQNNKKIPGALPKTCLRAISDSARTYGLFNAYFKEELYSYALRYYDNSFFGHDRLLYAVAGVTRVLESLEINKLNRPMHEDLTKCLSEDFSGIFDAAQIVRKFKYYFTARIDINFVSEKNAGDFQILCVSDSNARILKFEKSAGCAILSHKGKLEFVVKASVCGNLQLNLRGLAVPNPSNPSKHIPYWIDYTKLAVDGQLVFDAITPVWHDDFCRYDIKNIPIGREIKIQVEWRPHRSEI